MDAATGYIAIALAALGSIAVLRFATGRTRGPWRLTPLAAVAFALTTVGVLFGESRLVGYSLMGSGAALAVFDIARESRSAT